MKPWFFLAPLIALTLPSCVDLDTGGYYGGGGSSYGGGYSGGGYGSSYYRPGYSSYRPSYYGGSYYNRPDYYKYDHDDHKHSSSSKKDDDKIRLIGGSQPGKPNRPEGNHTADWYRKRGYDLSEYKHKHEDGTVHKGRNYDDDKKKKKKN
jgi:hypothetical protein